MKNQFIWTEDTKNKNHKTDKNVLLRERKRHTTRVTQPSCPCAGDSPALVVGTPVLSGVPPIPKKVKGPETRLSLQSKKDQGLETTVSSCDLKE